MCIQLCIEPPTYPAPAVTAVGQGSFQLLCWQRNLRVALLAILSRKRNISRRRNINWGVIAGLPAINQRFVIRFSVIIAEWTVFLFLSCPLVENASERAYFTPIYHAACNLQRCWVSTIQSVVLTANVFQSFIKWICREFGLILNFASCVPYVFDVLLIRS